MSYETRMKVLKSIQNATHRDKHEALSITPRNGPPSDRRVGDIVVERVLEPD